MTSVLMPRSWSAAILGLTILAGAAWAQSTGLSDEEAEARYSELHRAMEAAKVCRKLEFDEQDHLKMGEAINREVEHKIGTRRLTLLVEAQEETRALIRQKGCESPQVAELLGRFDAILAPAL
jgi:hypothetical protein